MYDERPPKIAAKTITPAAIPLPLASCISWAASRSLSLVIVRVNDSTSLLSCLTALTNWPAQLNNLTKMLNR